jgi:hypothetical protein
MTETGISKSCVSCGKNLNGQKRMKDSQGRYWCMECGAEDQRKKLIAGSGGANACSACGQTFPGHLLSKWGSRQLCPGCSPTNQKGPGMVEKVMSVFQGLGGGGGGGGTDKKKLFLMLAVMILLAAIAAYMNLT